MNWSFTRIFVLLLGVAALGLGVWLRFTDRDGILYGPCGIVGLIFTMLALTGSQSEVEKATRTVGSFLNGLF